MPSLTTTIEDLVKKMNLALARANKAEQLANSLCKELIAWEEPWRIEHASHRPLRSLPYPEL